MTEIYEITLKDIYSDPDFNCRGYIVPVDVADLARDIEKNGLHFPIAVQPSANINVPDGYKFRVVAGHRRFAAFTILKRDTIPCMVKRDLSELQARLINLSENLKRKELNIVQEASAIKRLRELGLTQENIAAELGMSRGWVQVRFNLLDLPESIQKEAAAGILNQAQIKQIYSLPDAESKYEAVKKIKNSQLQGMRGIDVGKKPQEKPFQKKRQPKNNVQDMIDHIGKNLGFGMVTRALAWANGAISSAELYFDIKTEMERQGKSYTLPFDKQ